MEKNQKKIKSKKFPKKIAVASLLAIVIIINLIHSTLQNVEAKGMFQNVQDKVTEIQNNDGQKLRILEILPDSSSLSVMDMLISIKTDGSGIMSFQDMIADYSDEQIKALADILYKYGIINLDSASSSIYPLTYYKPGDQDRIFRNVPVLSADETGYTLVDQQIVPGYYKEVSKSEFGSQLVYYQEIVSTTIVSPDTPVTQASVKHTRDTVKVAVAELQEKESPEKDIEEKDQETALTVVPSKAAQETEEKKPDGNVSGGEEVEVTEIPENQNLEEELEVTETPIKEDGEEPTPTPTPVLLEEIDSNLYLYENGEAVYLRYDEETFNGKVGTAQEKEGRYFRFIASGTEEYDQLISEYGELTEELGYYEGSGYRFAFGSKAEIRCNNLFTKFVLGITDDETTEADEVEVFNQTNIELSTISVEALKGQDLSSYDLVYMANPFLYRNSEGTISEYDYANPDLSEEERAGKYSPWVGMAATQNSDDFKDASIALLEGAVNESTPLKLMIDSSILDGYMTAFDNYALAYESLASDSTMAAPAATALEGMDNIDGSWIYKALLVLAQDDFGSQIRKISTATPVTGTNLNTYKIEEASYEALVNVDLKAALADGADPQSVYATNHGHFVNKNIYFYHYLKNDYSNPVLGKGTYSVLAVVNGDFRTSFKQGILKTSFADVVTAMEDENRRNAYLEAGRETMDTKEISVDMIIQYLLNYEGVTIEIKKNSLSVLELEPCADFSYDYNSDGTMSSGQKEFINKWIKYFAENNRYEDVKFTCMSMQEFVGKNEDLNATYDLIYIGSNIGKFQTTASGVRRFNDTSMTGLVYTHIGDLTGKKVGVGNGVGLLATDYVDSNRNNGLKADVRTVYYKGANQSWQFHETYMRTTGNDLTTYKKRDLLNFLASGYPVIVADNLLSYDTSGTPVAVNAEGESVSDGGGIPSSSTTRTIYIRKPKSGFYTAWDNIHVYAWGTSGKNAEFASAPKASYCGDDSNYYIYSISFDKAYTNCIIIGKNGASQTVGKTVDLTGLGNLDYYTYTLQKESGTIDGLEKASAVRTDGKPGSLTSGTATVDSSSYLYQVLKIATSNNATLSDITRQTLNYESAVSGLNFDWEGRVYPNLLTDKSTTNAHVEIAGFLNETKVYLNLTKRPTTYDYNTTSIAGNPIAEKTVDGKTVPDVEYLTADSNGRYSLQYEFTISTLAGSLSSRTFDCKLYVDANFDGKFSQNSEKLDSLVIKDASTGKIVQQVQQGDSYIYQLKEGSAYTLTRKLPKSFDGCVNWKLEVSDNQNSSILASETGYCAIPVHAKNQDGSFIDTGEKQKIKILQITSGNTKDETSDHRITFNGTHVNLQQQLDSGTGNWHNLLKNIPDFELDITSVSENDYADLCRSQGANYPIEQGYDMLILGFIDVYSECQVPEMLESIIQFAEQGRSILFTHDTTAWNGDYQHKGNYKYDFWEDDSNYTNAKNSAAYLTVAIRDLSGSDQYGVVTRKKGTIVDTSSATKYINQFFQTPASTGKTYSSTDSEWNELRGLEKDMAFKPNSKQKETVAETQGSTYLNLIDYNYDYDGNFGSKYNANNLVQYVKNLMPDNMTNGSKKFSTEKTTSETYTIEQVNEGAITEYPYILPTSIQVASTHAQYWTVDLESDTNNDDESDLVVWYCINKRSSGQDYYEKTPNDVRNNYYIYNKGNITYSGAGHYPISSDEEIKLFINTMIAAYNAQLKAPEISIVENGEPEADDLESVIIPYDTTVTPEEIGADFINFGADSDGTTGTMRVYFNVSDNNLTAKKKNIEIDEIFITDSQATATSAYGYKDSTGTTKLKGNCYTKGPDTGSSVTMDPSAGILAIYDAADTSDTPTPVPYDKLESTHTYYINAPLGTVFAHDQTIKVYVTMHTNIGEGDDIQKTTIAWDSLNVSRAELFDLD